MTPVALLAVQVPAMVTFGVLIKHVEKRKELERRRGARLLAAGHPQVELARRVGVSCQTVMHWEMLRQQSGLETLRRAEHFGRPEGLSESQREELVRFGAEGRVAGGRICDGALGAAADCSVDRGQVLGLDGALLSMAAARAPRLERAAAERPGARAQRTGDPRLESQEVARAKKSLRDKAE